jgi:bifunctional UDP-N-acetylglucosamine pyrophosphorylase/glucosamine-1-phosphate N-acetyltransferase
VGDGRRAVGVVLAGGAGTRMGSRVPKPLVLLHGRPLVGHVVAALGQVVDEVVVVTGADGAWSGWRGPGGTRLVTQAAPTGNGDALRLGLAAVADAATDVVVALADTPLLRAATFSAVLAASRPSALAVLTAARPGPGAYGPVVRDGAGRVVGFAEPNGDDGEVNASVYAAAHDVLAALVGDLPPGRAGGECLVTGVVPAAHRAGVEVADVRCDPAGDALGVNTPGELAVAAAALRRRASVGGTPCASPARRP